MSPRTDLVLRTALVVITVFVIAGLAWLLVQIEEIPGSEKGYEDLDGR